MTPLFNSGARLSTSQISRGYCGFNQLDYRLSDLTTAETYLNPQPMESMHAMHACKRRRVHACHNSVRLHNCYSSNLSASVGLAPRCLCAGCCPYSNVQAAICVRFGTIAKSLRKLREPVHNATACHAVLCEWREAQIKL
jgi:hypothetical protein